MNENIYIYPEGENTLYRVEREENVQWTFLAKEPGLHEGTGKFKDIDGWVRNRLRYCIWKHWRTERIENVRWTFLTNGPGYEQP